MDAVEQQHVMVMREACPGYGQLPVTYMSSPFEHLLSIA
jgi:hypothetical protein